MDNGVGFSDGAFKGMSDAEAQTRCSADANCAGYARMTGGDGTVYMRLVSQVDYVQAYCDENDCSGGNHMECVKKKATESPSDTWGAVRFKKQLIEI